MSEILGYPQEPGFYWMRQYTIRYIGDIREEYWTAWCLVRVEGVFPFFSVYPLSLRDRTMALEISAGDKLQFIRIEEPSND